MHPGHVNKFGQGAAVVLVGELTQDIKRLVEQDEHMRWFSRSGLHIGKNIRTLATVLEFVKISFCWSSTWPF